MDWKQKHPSYSKLNKAERIEEILQAVNELAPLSFSEFHALADAIDEAKGFTEVKVKVRHGFRPTGLKEDRRIVTFCIRGDWTTEDFRRLFSIVSSIARDTRGKGEMHKESNCP